jgi:hypothetical protein
VTCDLHVALLDWVTLCCKLFQLSLDLTFIQSNFLIDLTNDNSELISTRNIEDFPHGILEKWNWVRGCTFFTVAEAKTAECAVTPSEHCPDPI